MPEIAATIGVDADFSKVIQKANTLSGQIKPLVLRLDDNRFTGPLGSIRGGLQQFNKALDASNARVISFGASAGILYSFVRAFTSIARSTIDVHKSLTEIGVVLNTSTEGLNKFGNSLFDIAKNTGQSFKIVSQAALELSRQGLNVEETLKRTRDALILTRFTNLDAASSVEALTTAINSFDKAALTSTQIVNKLFNVDTQFAVSSRDLAEALSRVGSTAQDAGVGIDSLIGLVTSAKQITGRDGPVIGNSLKTIFQRLQRPEVLSQLEKLGVLTKDVAGNLLPVDQILISLARTYDTLAQSQQNQVTQLAAGVFQANIFKALLNDLAKANSVYTGATNASTNATNQAIQRNQELNKTLSALVNETFANLTKAGASIGKDAFEPLARRGLSIINALTSGFNFAEPEGFGEKIGSGILKGIGSFLAGPGALAILGILGRLTFKFTKDIAKDIGDLTGLNRVSQERANIEKLISGTISNQPALIERIKAGQLSVLDAERAVLNILNQELILRERLASVSTVVAKSAIAQNILRSSKNEIIARIPTQSTPSQGNIPPRKASEGFIPNWNRVQGGPTDAIIKAMSQQPIDAVDIIKNTKKTPFTNFDLGERQGGQGGYNKGFIPNFAPTVKSAALKFKNEIFTGPIHSIAYDKLLQKYPNTGYRENSGVQHGFMVKKSSFLNEEFLSRDETSKLLGLNTSFLASEDVGLGIKNKSSGLIPIKSSLKEKLGAYQGGYTPGQVKETNIKGLGKVTYNTAEKIKQFPGLEQPAIIPPKQSKAGINYKEKFIKTHGFNPYQAEGLVPNFATFIHGTSQQLVPKILKEGLLPSSQTFVRKTFPDSLYRNYLGDNRKNLVYVTKERNMAMSSLFERAKQGEKGSAILVLNIPNNYVKKHGIPDTLDESYNTNQAFPKIPKEFIKRILTLDPKKGGFKTSYKTSSGFSSYMNKGLVPNFASNLHGLKLGINKQFQTKSSHAIRDVMAKQRLTETDLADITNFFRNPILDDTRIIRRQPSRFGTLSEEEIEYLLPSKGEKGLSGLRLKLAVNPNEINKSRLITILPKHGIANEGLIPNYALTAQSIPSNLLPTISKLKNIDKELLLTSIRQKMFGARYGQLTNKSIAQSFLHRLQKNSLSYFSLDRNTSFSRDFDLTKHLSPELRPSFSNKKEVLKGMKTSFKLSNIFSNLVQQGSFKSYESEQFLKNINLQTGQIEIPNRLSQSFNPSSDIVTSTYSPKSNKKIGKNVSNKVFFDEEKGLLRFDFLTSGYGLERENPLFRIKSLLDSGQVKEIYVGGVIGEKIPSLLQILSEKYKGSGIKLKGYFSDSMLEDFRLNKMRNKDLAKLNSALSFFETSIPDIKKLNRIDFSRTLSKGLIPNFNALSSAIQRENQAGISNFATQRFSYGIGTQNELLVRKRNKENLFVRKITDKSGPNLLERGITFNVKKQPFEATISKETGELNFGIPSNEFGTTVMSNTNLGAFSTMIELQKNLPYLLSKVKNKEIVFTALDKTRSKLFERFLKKNKLDFSRIEDTFFFKNPFIKFNGLIPNFNALSSAIQRENSAGIPLSQIKVGQSNSLKSSFNPMGLGVYNTRDEPLGLNQGIKRTKSMGLDPKKAGVYNKGLVPSFASPFEFESFLLPEFQKKDILSKFNELKESVKIGKLKMDEAATQLSNNFGKVLSIKDAARMNASFRELEKKFKTLNPPKSILSTAELATKGPTTLEQLRAKKPVFDIVGPIQVTRLQPREVINLIKQGVIDIPSEKLLSQKSVIPKILPIEEISRQIRPKTRQELQAEILTRRQVRQGFGPTAETRVGAVNPREANVVRELGKTASILNRVKLVTDIRTTIPKETTFPDLERNRLLNEAALRRRQGISRTILPELVFGPSSEQFNYQQQIKRIEAQEKARQLRFQTRREELRTNITIPGRGFSEIDTLQSRELQRRLAINRERLTHEAQLGALQPKPALTFDELKSKAGGLFFGNKRFEEALKGQRITPEQRAELSGLRNQRSQAIQNRALITSFVAPMIGETLAQFIGTETRTRRGLGATASGLGNIASFAALGASFGGLPGLAIGGTLGLLTSLPKIFEGFTDIIPDLTKEFDRLKSSFTEISNSTSSYIQISERLKEIQQGNIKATVGQVALLKGGQKQELAKIFATDRNFGRSIFGAVSQGNLGDAQTLQIQFEQLLQQNLQAKEGEIKLQDLIKRRRLTEEDKDKIIKQIKVSNIGAVGGQGLFPFKAGETISIFGRKSTEEAAPVISNLINQLLGARGTPKEGQLQGKSLIDFLTENIGKPGGFDITNLQSGSAEDIRNFFNNTLKEINAPEIFKKSFQNVFSKLDISQLEEFAKAFDPTQLKLLAESIKLSEDANIRVRKATDDFTQKLFESAVELESFNKTLQNSVKSTIQSFNAFIDRQKTAAAGFIDFQENFASPEVIVALKNLAANRQIQNERALGVRTAGLELGADISQSFGKAFSVFQEKIFKEETERKRNNIRTIELLNTPGASKTAFEFAAPFKQKIEEILGIQNIEEVNSALSELTNSVLKEKQAVDIKLKGDTSNDLLRIQSEFLGEVFKGLSSTSIDLINSEKQETQAEMEKTNAQKQIFNQLRDQISIQRQISFGGGIENLLGGSFEKDLLNAVSFKNRGLQTGNTFLAAQGALQLGDILSSLQVTDIGDELRDVIVKGTADRIRTSLRLTGLQTNISPEQLARIQVENRFKTAKNQEKLLTDLSNLIPPIQDSANMSNNVSANLLAFTGKFDNFISLAQGAGIRTIVTNIEDLKETIKVENKEIKPDLTPFPMMDIPTSPFSDRISDAWNIRHIAPDNRPFPMIGRIENPQFDNTSFPIMERFDKEINEQLENKLERFKKISELTSVNFRSEFGVKFDPNALPFTPSVRTQKDLIITKNKDISEKEIITDAASIRVTNLEKQLTLAKNDLKEMVESGKVFSDEIAAAVDEVNELNIKLGDFAAVDFKEAFFGPLRYGAKDFVRDFKDEIKSVGGDFKSGLSGALKDLVRGKGSIGEVFREAALNFLYKRLDFGIDQTVNQLGNLFAGLFKGKQGGMNVNQGDNTSATVASNIGSVIAAFFGSKGKYQGGIIKRYSQGGLVTGGSGVKDDVPALLTEGEYVISKAAIERIKGSDTKYREEQKENRLRFIKYSEVANKPLPSLVREFSTSTSSGINALFKNAFVYNDPRRPTSAAMQYDRRLSEFALMDENNPQNINRLRREETFYSYIKELNDYIRMVKRTRQHAQSQKETALYTSVISAVLLGALSGLNRGNTSNQRGTNPGTGYGPQNIGGTTGTGYGTRNAQGFLINPNSPGNIGGYYPPPGGRYNGGLIKGYAMGGRVFGGQSPTDNIPTMLTGGEYVVKKDIVRKFGKDYFDRINYGTKKGYAEGGLVGSNVGLGINTEDISNYILKLIDITTSLRETINRNIQGTATANNNQTNRLTPQTNTEEGRGIIVNSSITINIDKNGNVSSNIDNKTNQQNNNQEDIRRNRELTKLIEAQSTQTIIENLKPGGLLYGNRERS